MNVRDIIAATNERPEYDRVLDLRTVGSVSAGETSEVWLDIAMVDDPRIEGWPSLGSTPEDRPFTRVPDEVRSVCHRYLAGAIPDTENDEPRFAPVTLVNRSNRHQGVTLVQASCFVVDAIGTVLAQHPAAVINVSARVPRAVAFGAGILLARRPKWAGDLLETTQGHGEGSAITMDFWERVRLWGPIYDSGGNRGRGTETCVGLSVFNVVEPLAE